MSSSLDPADITETLTQSDITHHSSSRLDLARLKCVEEDRCKLHDTGRWQLPGPMLAVAVLLLHLLSGTVMFYKLECGTRPTMSDSFYWAVISFLTIGYGDLTPEKAETKWFFMSYIFQSMIIQAGLGGYIISSVLTLKRRTKLSPEVETDVFMRIRPKLVNLIQACAALVFMVFLGAAMLHSFDGAKWLDAFYWASVTLSTVGFGDITPNSHKALFAVYFLVGVLVVTYCFAYGLQVGLEVMHARRLQKFFEHGITREVIARMDYMLDNQVSQFEFTLFMLRELDLVSEENLERIIGMFNSLDQDNDGYLDFADMDVDALDIASTSMMAPLREVTPSLAPLMAAEL